MPLVGGFGCLELVLYCIRELAQQHYQQLILLQSEINEPLWYLGVLTNKNGQLWFQGEWTGSSLVWGGNCSIEGKLCSVLGKKDIKTICLRCFG